MDVDSGSPGALSDHMNSSVGNTPSGSGDYSQLDNGFSSVKHPGQLPNLNMLDLELFHNFSTSTALSLSCDPILKNLWRIKVPQIGLSHGFVMRGILALSAMHLAHFRPERRDFYVSHAALQHQLALREAAAVLPNVTTDNCTAIYIFSAITCIYKLATPRKPGDFLLVGEPGITEWMSLFRGVRVIIESADEALSSGPLAPMFQAGRRRVQLRESHRIEDDHLSELRSLILRSTFDSRLAEVYARAIDELQKSFGRYHSPELPQQSYETSDVFVWIFEVSDEYLMLLREKAQEALTIFAYLCVLFKRLEHFWWMEGWSLHLMSGIYEALDEEHRLWIRWPIEEIGCVLN